MGNYHYTYIIIVLVYRNHEDLEECLQSFRKAIKSNYKCVVVNAFYDEESKIKIKEVSQKYGADFLNEKNKGYGYGNNKGIEYAVNQYDYEFIIISNPDIIVRKFDGKNLKSGNVYAPIIITSIIHFK